MPLKNSSCICQPRSIYEKASPGSGLSRERWINCFRCVKRELTLEKDKWMSYFLLSSHLWWLMARSVDLCILRKTRKSQRRWTFRPMRRIWHWKSSRNVLSVFVYGLLYWCSTGLCACQVLLRSRAYHHAYRPSTRSPNVLWTFVPLLDSKSSIE